MKTKTIKGQTHSKRYGPKSALVAFALAALCGTPPSAIQLADAEPVYVETKDASGAFLRMADRHASLILRAMPEWATQLGVSEEIGGRGYSRRLSDLSPAGNARLARMTETLLAELNEVERAALSGTALVTYDVMRNAYEVAARQNAHGIGIASVLWANQPFATDQLFGQHIGMPRFFAAQIPITNEEQLDDYLARLAELDRVMSDIGDLVEADARNGAIPPKVVLRSVVDSARSFVSSDADKHPFVTSLRDKLDGIRDLSPEEKSAAIETVRTLLIAEIYPAFVRYADRVAALVSRASDDAGIWRLKGGSELYQIALDNYGANGLTAEQIHRIGMEDVRRIHAEMDRILRTIGYSDGDVGTRMNALSKDPSVLRPNTDEAKLTILQQLNKYVAGMMAIAPQWFGEIPQQVLEVRRIPGYEESSAAGAYYTPPSLDGSQPGVFWINLKDTADWPIYSLQTLVYHEGVPGHHFQAASQLNITDMPLIRKMMWFGDYGEGWALYTEALAFEMGLYDDDPLGNLGRLKAELYRAARLVVDTGLHEKRWSRSKAIDWMVEITGETRASISREIDRYSVWPGQATSYKIGMIKFQRIREKAERELADNFDIRNFHDALLEGGAMPMPVLEARMDEWIRSQKNGSSRLRMLPEPCEVSLALSAAPPHLRELASVYALKATGYELVNQGRNSFTCIVNRDDPRVLKPTCFDAEGTETIVPKIRYVGRRLLRGEDVKSINASVRTEFQRGTFVSPRRPGVAYMLSRYNRPVDRQTGKLGFFPPHVMFYAPDLTNEDIGHDPNHHNAHQPLPMIAYGGPQGYMIMISDDGKSRSRDDLDGSCPDWVFREQ